MSCNEEESTPKKIDRVMAVAVSLPTGLSGGASRPKRNASKRAGQMISVGLQEEERNKKAKTTDDGKKKRRTQTPPASARDAVAAGKEVDGGENKGKSWAGDANRVDVTGWSNEAIVAHFTAGFPTLDAAGLCGVRAPKVEVLPPDEAGPSSRARKPSPPRAAAARSIEDIVKKEPFDNDAATKKLHELAVQLADERTKNDALNEELIRERLIRESEQVEDDQLDAWWDEQIAEGNRRWAAQLEEERRISREIRAARLAPIIALEQENAARRAKREEEKRLTEARLDEEDAVIRARTAARYAAMAEMQKKMDAAREELAALRERKEELLASAARKKARMEAIYQ